MPAPLSIDLRNTIQEKLDCGLTHESIAEDLSISRSAVTNLKKHIEIYGHIYPIKPPGNNPTYTEDDYPIIKSIVEEKTDLTLLEYSELIAKKTNKPVMSTPTICRLLKKLNFNRKKKSKYPEERDRPENKKKREDFIEARDELIENDEIDLENLIFLDESGTKLGQTSDYGRAEGGKRVVASEPKNLGKNITIISAISIFGVVTAMYCTCTFDSSGFSAFIKNFLLPKLEPGQILIMDNVNFHKVESIINIIEKASIRVVFLPPYSPELNPIENMWSKLKSYLKKNKVKTFDQLQKFLKKGLEKITGDDCEAWFEHCGYVV